MFDGDQEQVFRVSVGWNADNGEVYPFDPQNLKDPSLFIKSLIIKKEVQIAEFYNDITQKIWSITKKIAKVLIMLVSKDLFERMKELIKSLRKAIKRIVAFNIELMKENDDLIDELKGFKSKEKYGKYLTRDEIDLNRYEKYQMQNQIEELEEENKNFSKYLELNGLDSDEIEWIKNPKMAKMALLEEEEEEFF